MARCEGTEAVIVRTVWMLVVLAGTAFGAGTAKKTVRVGADGSGQFRTVQEAVDSAPEGNVVVRIRPGVYRQVLTIKANGVTLRGMGKRPQDVVLTYDNSAKMAGGTTKSASTTVSGDDFYAENVTFENSWERANGTRGEGAQAVALLVNGDREVFRRVRFLGYQDTLYANSKTCHGAGETGACRASRQYFTDCYVEGHVDFIFGDAKAVFERCEIHAMAHPVVTITAQSRVRPEEDSGYLFRDCVVTAEEGAKDILLGRPWRAYSTVVWVGTEFKAALDAKGWAEWDGRLATSDYEEYGSRGNAGDVTLRVGERAGDAGSYGVREWLGGWDALAVR